MVGHHAKRKDPNPTVGLVTPHQFYKRFLFQLAQNKVPVYHPGNIVVVSDLHRSLGLESRAPRTPLATDAKGKRFYPSVCPLRSLQGEQETRRRDSRYSEADPVRQTQALRSALRLRRALAGALLRALNLFIHSRLAPDPVAGFLRQQFCIMVRDLC